MEKDFTTFERQIEILKERNLQFVSEDSALATLKYFGYYNIINGYKDPYIIIKNDKEYFKDGVTFEQVYSLYRLDKDIRNGLLAAMLDIEENLRTAVAHTISEAFSANQKLYLKKENYRPGKKKKDGIYQIDEILNKFQKISNDDVEPIKHYREIYHNIPPWILLKGASFGNLINFVKLQKGPQKNRIVSLMYGMPIQIVEELPEIKDLFMDTLFVCLDYRNRAAHGGRIYNFETKSKFRFSTILHKKMQLSEGDYRKGKGNSGLSALVDSIYFLNNKDPYFKLLGYAKFFIEEHCKLYPNDKEYLSKFLKITD